jgi:hypothetical protein
MTDVGPPVAADTLTRAADLVEKMALAVAVGGTGPCWAAEESGYVVAKSTDGAQAGDVCEWLGRRVNGRWVASFDPVTVTALVPALRAAALWEEQPAPPFRWATKPLLTFARRLLREEEGTDG